MIKHVTIVGTGLIGASIGLALREAGFSGEIDGWDASFESLDAAYRAGAITSPLPNRPQTEETKPEAGVVVLAGPVLSILDWMESSLPFAGRTL